MLSKREATQLFLQRILSLAAVPILYPIGWMWFTQFRKYKIKEMRTLRREFFTIKQQKKGPLLICSNHLTFIDSILLIWIFGSPWDYLKKFQLFAWNFPKLSYLKENLFFRIVCYLSKCIAVDREASSDTAKQTLKIASYLLSCNDCVTIFPEGKRGKNGRVDTEDFIYGVGQLVREISHTRVLCVYLRGSTQTTPSKFPAKGDSFSCKLKLINPQTQYNGLRADRDLATKIIQTLSQMEHEYFSSIG